jgi:hypothetical protein
MKTVAAGRLPRIAPAIVIAIAVAGMAIHGPIAQLANYHSFADQRSLAGLPNGLDVLSNLGFAAAGAWGLWMLRDARARRSLGDAWPGYMLFASSVLLTAFGSGYYHLAPDDARLIWDRLPIALACAGLLAGAVSDSPAGSSRHEGRHVATLACLAAFALGSVAWWSVTADLRPYLLIQAAPLILVPLWHARHGSPRGERRWFAAAIALYVVAKGAELADHAIYQGLSALSGHTLKHLLAGLASAAILAGLRARILARA